MAKANKTDVDYSVGMEKSHCGKVFKDDEGYCKHFVKPSACQKVSGYIDPVYWCKLWEKAD
jgi:hypothetical protein